MSHVTVDDLYTALRKLLAAPGYAKTYGSEPEFEAAVWGRLIKLFGQNTGACCLTSHQEHGERSAEAWKAFCCEDSGPDVNVLGSKNRLDIVVKHSVQGSIGIEVKCLGNGGHVGKLTQGLGQAMLALAHRDRTLLLIHCGTVKTEDREKLRKIANEICRGTRISIIVVP
jgi:hypothetical protein